jgi:hypothetical protein
MQLMSSCDRWRSKDKNRCYILRESAVVVAERVTEEDEVWQ